MNLVDQAHQMVQSLSKDNPAAVYILRLASGILYVGSTESLFQRMADHMDGIACKTTRDDKPLALIYAEPQPTFPLARKREAQIKRWSRAKKLALAGGDIKALQRLSKSGGIKNHQMQT